MFGLLVFGSGSSGPPAAVVPPMTDLYTDIYTDQSPNFFMRGCDITVSSGVYGTTK